MKRRYLFILILLMIFQFYLSGCEKQNTNNNLEENRLNSETNIDNPNNSNTERNINSLDEKNTIKSTPESTPIETEIGKFSTTILDKTENRQSNIRLTCSKLNNFTVNSR